MTTPRLSARARRQLEYIGSKGWNFVPQQTGTWEYITQATLVRAGLAAWTNHNTIELTDAGRAQLEQDNP